MTIEKLLELVREYNPEEVGIVKKAYEFAAEKHSGQKRDSGEPYIIHPLNVAYTLAEWHVDKDTLCAGLLHDVLEDSNVTKEEIASRFDPEIAELVDGVTKLSKLEFSSKEERNLANIRKLYRAFLKDARVIFIKLADNCHNLSTLEYKAPEKQKENAAEAMIYYVPFAYHTGVYSIKNEMEDYALKYTYPDMYKKYSDIREKIYLDNIDMLLEMKYKIERFLTDKGISHDVKLRVKNTFGIYKQVEMNEKKISSIHDLLAIKVIVDTIENCYMGLMGVQSNYQQIDEYSKNWLHHPKLNDYRSMHTVVFGPNNGKFVQFQIRTFDMDKVDSYGLTALWDINKGNTRFAMQEALRKKYPFFNTILNIESSVSDNAEFLKMIKNDFLCAKVYVRSPNGEMVELPKGSTPIDYAFYGNSDLGLSMYGVRISNNEMNNELVPFDYVLKNKDRIIILNDVYDYGRVPKLEWADMAYTNNARKRILSYYKK